MKMKFKKILSGVTIAGASLATLMLVNNNNVNAAEATEPTSSQTTVNADTDTKAKDITSRLGFLNDIFQNFLMKEEYIEDFDDVKEAKRQSKMLNNLIEQLGAHYKGDIADNQEYLSIKKQAADYSAMVEEKLQAMKKN